MKKILFIFIAFMLLAGFVEGQTVYNFIPGKNDTAVIKPLQRLFELGLLNKILLP